MPEDKSTISTLERWRDLLASLGIPVGAFGGILIASGAYFIGQSGRVWLPAIFGTAALIVLLSIWARAKKKKGEEVSHRRGLYWKHGDPIPFCPVCHDAGRGLVHWFSLSMMNPQAVGWRCKQKECPTDFVAIGIEDFRPLKQVGP